MLLSLCYLCQLLPSLSGFCISAAEALLPLCQLPLDKRPVYQKTIQDCLGDALCLLFGSRSSSKGRRKVCGFLLPVVKHVVNNFIVSPQCLISKIRWFLTEAFLEVLPSKLDRHCQLIHVAT